MKRVVLITATLTPRERAVLHAPLAALPSPRVHAVLRAREAWIENGLATDTATTRAADLAKRLSPRVVKDARSTKLSKVAERHEKYFKQTFFAAIRAAQDVLTQSVLEHELSGHAVNPDIAIRKMLQVLGA